MYRGRHVPSEVSAVLDSVDAYLTPVEFDKQMLPMHIHVFATFCSIYIGCSRANEAVFVAHL